MNLNPNRYITIDDGTTANNTYIISTSASTVLGVSTYDSNVTAPYNGSEYKVRKRKEVKKKRGDLTGANSKDKRIRPLSPTVMYAFLKSRFTLIQQTKLSKQLELVCKMLENAKKLGQTALKEGIEKEFGVMLREQEMVACGFTEFVSSKLLERFVDSIRNKVVKITPIKNYVRVIPKSVLKKKEKADKAGLFDSYVVLHTDPNDTSVKKTEAEKRDPILFGLITGSNRYYFVADWVDELCDITFDTLLEHLKLSKDDTGINDDLKERVKAFIR